MNKSNTTPSIYIFSDAATSSQHKISVGAFLYLTTNELGAYSTLDTQDFVSTLSAKVMYREYPSNKSTWSEIKTVIEALYVVNALMGSKLPIEIYTDCQSLCDLLNKRKEKLQKNNFMTVAGKVLAHAELYKELFKLTEHVKISTHKIKGHATANNRITVYDKIFDVLDKLTRNRLRAARL